jgi:hypothetical protein
LRGVLALVFVVAIESIDEILTTQSDYEHRYAEHEQERLAIFPNPVRLFLG